MGKPQVKVLFIYAFEIDDIELRRELPFLKVDEFIKKPILLQDFISTISKHIKKKSNTLKIVYYKLVSFRVRYKHINN